LGLFGDSRSGFGPRFPERAMGERTMIWSLVLASLINVVGIYLYL
jgi:hypothetical protein